MWRGFSFLKRRKKGQKNDGLSPCLLNHKQPRASAKKLQAGSLKTTYGPLLKGYLLALQRLLHRLVLRQPGKSCASLCASQYCLTAVCITAVSCVALKCTPSSPGRLGFASNTIFFLLCVVYYSAVSLAWLCEMCCSLLSEWDRYRISKSIWPVKYWNVPESGPSLCWWGRITAPAVLASSSTGAIKLDKTWTPTPRLEILLQLWVNYSKRHFHLWTDRRCIGCIGNFYSPF